MTKESQEPAVLHPPEPPDAEPVVHPLVPSTGADAPESLAAVPLPEELDRLGDQLERAARSSLRRRTRRGQWLQSFAIILLAAPAAVGILSTDLAPSVSVGAAVTVTDPFEVMPPSHGFSVAYIPDEPVLVTAPRSCLDGRDCAVPASPDDTITALEGKL